MTLRIDARLAACSAIAVMGISGAFLGDGSDQWMTLVFLLWIASAAVFAWPYYPRNLSGLKRGNKKVRASELYQNPFDRFWFFVERYVPRIKRIRERYAKYLLSKGAGLPYDHDTHARRAVHIALTISPVLSLPALVGPEAVLAVVIPLIALLYPLLHLQSEVSAHKTKVEEEMAFFMCYLSTMQGVGYTLYSAFDQIKSGEMFPAIARDAKNVIRDVTLGFNHMDALRKYAENQPVKVFKDFLFGYISKHETVGPVPEYTHEKAKRAFESYQESWRRYKDSAGILGGMAMMVSVMIPVLLIVTTFISTPATVNMIFSFSPVMGPLFAVMLYFAVKKSQPSTGMSYRPWKPSLGIGMAAGILAHIVQSSMTGSADIWDTEVGVSVAVAFAAFAAANAIMVRKTLSGSDNIDRGLPEFLDDVTQQTVSGSSISTILRQQARSDIYKGEFGALLRGLVGRIEAGANMHDACSHARSRSRYMGFALFIIEKLQAAGSTSPKLLEEMTQFLSGIVAVKVEVMKTLRMISLMMYVAPIAAVGLMHVMFGMTNSGVDLSVMGGMLPPGAIESMVPLERGIGFEQRFGLLIALMTCPLGVIAAKISSFTAVDTRPLLVTSSMCAASLLLVPQLLERLGV